MNQRGGLACCAVCKTETTRRCSRCLDIYYCNRDHQRDDWKRHKSECLPKLTEEEPRKDKHITQEAATRNVEKSPEPKENINRLHQHRSQNSVKSSTKKSHGSQQKKDCSAFVNSKQTTTESRKQKNGATTSDQSVNKIVELLKTGSIVKSNVIYCKDLNKDSAITYEGSSEKEILSESAQQLNNVEFAKPMGSAPNVLKSVNRVGCKMPAMSTYMTEAPPRLGHKEYPADSSLKNNIQNNYLMDSADPCYEVCQRVIRDMTQYGVCVLDNFLGKDKGLLVLKEVLEMYRSGIFTAGQLVSNPGSTEAKTIRSDNITWIDGKEPHCSNIGTLINQVDSIILRANKMQHNGKMGDYNINGRTKAMVACYPGSGSHYVKHVDNPNKDGRCITAIYYLNLDWDVARNGGLLRVFPEGTDTVANIQPIFDRMLFFWSDRRNPHEVQPAYATRYAITLWYFDAQEREEALRLYKSRGKQPPTTK